MANTTTPISSQGTTLRVKVASAFVQVKGFTDFSGIGGGSPTIIDVSDLSSTAKEKMAGLPDEGQISISLDYIPDDAGQVALDSARSNITRADIQLTLADGTQWACSGYVLTFDKSGGVDTAVTASVTFEITGSVTKSKAV